MMINQDCVCSQEDLDLAIRLGEEIKITSPDGSGTAYWYDGCFYLAELTPNKEKITMDQSKLVKYLGVKFVSATVMNIGDYNLHRGWTLPADEDPTTEGFLVVYPDGYQSWSPSAQFIEANRPCNSLTFGHAIEAVKKGKRIARAGWNGKGMFVYLVKGTDVSSDLLRNEASDAFDAKYGDEIMVPGVQSIGSHFDMMAADGTIVVGWLASQTDMLAEDWMIVG